MPSQGAKASIGCWPILILIIIGAAGWMGYRAYSSQQQMAGLSQLVLQAAAAARAQQMAPALKDTATGATPPPEFGEAVSGFLSAKMTTDIPVFSTASNTFKAPLAIVDLDKPSIDETQERLPSSVRAPDVASAETLVFVRCFKRKVGEYGWLQGAYKRSCTLVGFDMKAPGGPKMLASNSFDREPPRTVSTAEFWYAFHDVVAPRPVSNLAWFVKVQLGLISASTPP